MTTQITITKTVRNSKPQLAVVCPYSPLFPSKAKLLGGRFENKYGGAPTWYFDPRDEAKVREILVTIYGTDGTATGDLLTIRASAKVLEKLGGKDTEYWLAGRQVARVTGRDSGARLGDGVVLVRGGFSAGSMKYPTIGFKDGTVVEIRDVPRAAAEKAFETYHGVTLLDADSKVAREATEPEPEPESEEARLAAALHAETVALVRAENEMARAQGAIAGILFRTREMGYDEYQQQKT